MRTSSFTVDILSAIIIVSYVSGVSAQQDSFFWRLRGAVGGGSKARDPSSGSYGGPGPHEREYSFPPPYGYPPKSTTSEESITYVTVHVTDTVTGKCSALRKTVH